MIPADISWAMFLSPFGIPIIAIISVFVWLAIVSISEEVGKVMRHRTDADLKMELLARGLGSEEIARIVEAGRDSEVASAGTHHPAGPVGHAVHGRV